MEACKAFDTPITGGNVSFYNETLGEGIYPTPVIGMVGLIEPVSQTTGSGFMKEGHAIVLLGPLSLQDEYSEAVAETWSALVDNLRISRDLYTDWVNQLPCPPLSIDCELKVQRSCLEAIRSGLLISAHDCSDGGLVVALAEMCFSRYEKPSLGADITLPQRTILESLLFGEFPSRIIATLESNNLATLRRIAEKNSIDVLQLGEVSGSRLRIRVGEKVVIHQPVSVLEETWRNSIGKHFQIAL